MKRLTTTIALLAAPALSLAHVPAADAALGETLSHQLLSVHHLPLTLVLLAIALAGLRVREQRAKLRRDDRR